MPSDSSVSRIAEYDLLKQIGQGGYGSVYAARKNGQIFALKVLSGSAAEREARSFQLYFEKIQKNEACILEPLESGVWNDCFYYVMPLADALYPEGDAASVLSELWAPKTLYSLIRIHLENTDGSWFSREDIIAIAENLFRAVEFLESKSLLHRDIKPDNILFFGGKAYLGDMGVAAEDKFSTESLTSHEFSAPDWYMASAGSPDIWGLAMTLYMLITGYSPAYIGRSFARIPANLADNAPEAEKEQFFHWHRCILRAIQSNPADRFVSLQDFKRTFLSQDFEASKIDSDGRENRRTLTVAICFIVCLLLLVAGIFLWLHDSKNSVAGDAIPASPFTPLVPVRTDKTPNYHISFWQGGGWITQQQADTYVTEGKGVIVESSFGKAFVPSSDKSHAVPQVFIIDRTPTEDDMGKEMEAVIDIVLAKAAKEAQAKEFAKEMAQEPEKDRHFLVDDKDPVPLRSDKKPDYKLPMFAGGWITRSQADEMLAQGRGRIVESSFGLSFVPNYNVLEGSTTQVFVIDRTPTEKDMRDEVFEVYQIESKASWKVLARHKTLQKQKDEQRKAKNKEAVGQ